MENYLEKRFMAHDGKFRLSIYQDCDAENPRYTTDEPLHCEDYNRDYTIMTNDERKGGYNRSYRDGCEWLLKNYGDSKKIIAKLKANAKEKLHSMYDNALVYNRSLRSWQLMMYYKPYQQEVGWYCEESYEGSIDEIDMFDLLENMSDECIYDIIDDCLTDAVKVASYEFGYNGEVSFSDTLGNKFDGLAWLDKKEFLTYSGCDEKRWQEKTLKEIEFLLGELEAWGDNDVYGYTIEKYKKYKVHKECFSHDEPVQDYEEEEWEETDACWGFYGSLDDCIKWIVEGYTDFKMDDLEEVEDAA